MASLSASNKKEIVENIYIGIFSLLPKVSSSKDIEEVLEKMFLHLFNNHDLFPREILRGILSNFKPHIERLAENEINVFWQNPSVLLDVPPIDYEMIRSIYYIVDILSVRLNAEAKYEICNKIIDCLAQLDP